MNELEKRIKRLEEEFENNKKAYIKIIIINAFTLFFQSVILIVQIANFVNILKK